MFALTNLAVWRNSQNLLLRYRDREELACGSFFVNLEFGLRDTRIGLVGQFGIGRLSGCSIRLPYVIGDLACKTAGCPQFPRKLCV